MTTALIPNPEPLAAVFSFQRVTNCPICNSFVLITVATVPRGWVESVWQLDLTFGAAAGQVSG